ncbi:MAG: hypothetical protein P1V97_09975 [Planctomycetota bacterium]|nr:hypothetical protein [Planctomycetota bacterium]
MKVVQRYRHEDGRTLELCEEGNDNFSLLQIYPAKDQLEKELTREDAESKIKELGYEIDGQCFSPPCPNCRKDCGMSLETGLYFCEDCQTAY